MSVFDVIQRRRSIGKMTEERPTRKQIERLLEAATHAPNHHKVEPWRFFVLAGEARKELAEEMGLACMWRTGDAAYDARVKRWLGLEPEDAIVAFLYVGFPAIPKLERYPTSFAQKTTWLGWEA